MTEILYDGAVVATIPNGNKATIPVKDLTMKSDIEITVPKAEDSALPIEVSTEAEMTALLESGEVGGVYKYTGETTVTYENGALYVLEEDLLRGVWVFNDVVTTVTKLAAPIDFVSNAQAFIKMSVALKMKMTRITYVSEDDSYTVYDGSRWSNIVAYKTVNISTTFAQLSANYEKANEFLAFMQTNATRQSNSFTKLINQSDLEKITITENGEYASSRAGFSKVTVNVPGSDTFIEGGLTEVVLPTATKLKDYAFYKDSTIRNIEMPNVTSIGVNAFSGCTNLALTELPSGLTSIGVNAFYGCTGLTSLTFKGTPTNIFSTAFNGCTNLTTINVPWAEGAVAGAPWGATSAQINYNYTEES